MKEKEELIKCTQRDYGFFFKLHIVSEVKSEELKINNLLRKYCIQPTDCIELDQKIRYL